MYLSENILFHTIRFVFRISDASFPWDPSECRENKDNRCPDWRGPVTGLVRSTIPEERQVWVESGKTASDLSFCSQKIQGRETLHTKKAVIVFIDGNTGIFVSMKASRGIIGCKHYFVFILTMLIALHTDILINVILNLSDCCLSSTLWTKTKLASFQERRIICRSPLHRLCQQPSFIMAAWAWCWQLPQLVHYTGKSPCLELC